MKLQCRRLQWKRPQQKVSQQIMKEQKKSQQRSFQWTKYAWKKCAKLFIVESVISLAMSFNIFGMAVNESDFFEDLETEYNAVFNTYDTKPVESSIFMPLDDGSGFIPAHKSRDDQKVMSFSVYGTNHSYELKGLWNDKGCHKRYLENRGLSRDEYIKRYGFSSNERGEGTDIDGYIYLDAGETITLSEPDQFDSYQWCISSDGKDGAYQSIDGGNENQLTITEPLDGKKYYHCEATVKGSDQKFILGENYSVEYYRLPIAKGIRIREVV